MGKKINPIVFRMGLSEKWRSRWYSGKDFAEFLKQDISIRSFIKKELREAGLDKVEIERSRGEVTNNIMAAKPGIIIGRGGAGIEELKKKIAKRFLEYGIKLKINITEISMPSLSAAVIVQGIREDIEKRIPFRRVMKQNIDKVMRAGAKGVKIVVAGRLNGAEIARTEKLTEGKIPLQTLRSDIDYSRGMARTIYGVIGIKVWIYKGEYFDKKKSDKGKKRIPQDTVKLFAEGGLRSQARPKITKKQPIKKS